MYNHAPAFLLFVHLSLCPKRRPQFDPDRFPKRASGEMGRSTCSGIGRLPCAIERRKRQTLLLILRSSTETPPGSFFRPLVSAPPPARIDQLCRLNQSSVQ